MCQTGTKMNGLWPLVLCLVVSLLPSGLRSDRTPCCWPTKYEAFLEQKNGLYQSSMNYAVIQDIQNTIHVDYDRQMIVNEEIQVSGGVTQVFTYIHDYKKKIIYTINGFDCDIDNLQFDMGGNCVPENANFLSSQDILGVMSETWFVPSATAAKSTFSSRLTVSQQGCVLLQEIFLQFGDVNELVISTAKNFTAGIIDPSIFNIPPFCNQTRPHTGHSSHQKFHRVPGQFMSWYSQVQA